MPQQTKETALPKPSAAPVDWSRIAQSGRVWDFLEGEDFNGNIASFKARKKTEARKAGIDFESVVVQRAGKSVLKILASPITHKPARTASATTPRVTKPQREPVREAGPVREPDPQLFVA
jgi:hypothetical protein